MLNHNAWVDESQFQDSSMPHTTKTQMTLVLPKSLSQEGQGSLGRVGHGQKGELQLLLQTKLPGSDGPCCLKHCSSPCHTLSLLGSPSFKAGQGPPSRKLPPRGRHLAGSSQLFCEMGCRTELLWKPWRVLRVWLLGRRTSAKPDSLKTSLWFTWSQSLSCF